MPTRATINTRLLDLATRALWAAMWAAELLDDRRVRKHAR